ncbi:MAG: polysaccharide pyruvyl transferase family protein [Rhodobacteraceae bacterium]|nr:polysaccharide pyruvyl transferase family protein [Paracoccaceae bacterium]
MKIGIISTFPKTGSKNIGDYLISRCSEDAIKKVLPDSQITQFFRADKWEDIRESLLAQDHLVFACLAIRDRNMASKIYPYIDEIIRSGIPFTVLAAGTQLPVHKKKMLAPKHFSRQSRELLNELNQKSRGFSARGCMTQEFCTRLGLQSENLGDIAFYDERFSARKFEPSKPIEKIVISDPHYWRSFLHEFRELYFGLQEIFPKAKIVIALHGQSGFRGWLDKESLDYLAIYEDSDHGLDVYDDADIHVGFRVHAHVSALKQRKYSYLIEQDGRGCDYGRFMNANISIPCYINKASLTLSKLMPLPRLDNAKSKYRSSAITRLLATISKDHESGFSCFGGLEGQIEAINDANLEFLARNLV